MTQVAISCVLLVGAVLFARSLQTLTHLDAGFQPDLQLQVSTSEEGPKGLERVRHYGRVLERVASVPGVRSTPSLARDSFRATHGRKR